MPAAPKAPDDIMSPDDAPADGSTPKGSKMKEMADKFRQAMTDGDPASLSDEPKVKPVPLDKDKQVTQDKDDKATAPDKTPPPKKGKPDEKSLPKLKTVASPEPKPDPDPDPAGDVDDDDSVPDSIKSPKAADDFRKIKSILKSTTKELEAAKAALAERDAKPAPAPGPSQEDYEAAVAERKKLQEQLETVALERSSRFQSKYSGVFESATARAKDAVGQENAAKLEGLMALPPSKWRNQQIETIRETVETGVEKAQLDLAVAEMDRARMERDKELANAHENFQALQAEEAKSQEAKEAELKIKRAKMVSEAERLASMSTAFEKVDGQDGHNAEVDARLARVKKFLNGEVDEATVATYAVMAEEDQYLSKQYIPALHARVEELEAEIKAIKGAGPSLGERKPVGDATKGRKGKGFMATYLENAPDSET